MKTKPKKRSVILWDRCYTILRYEAPPLEQAGPLEPRCLGLLDWEKRTIHIRACESPVEEARTILHELIHHAMDEQYRRISEKQMKKLDGNLYANLVACGVDLSPLLKGYE